MDELIGKKIDNYKIISVLGKGGMGVVYKAYDTKLERYVAIKMLSSQLFAKSRYVERFKREAKNQAKLSHPNIVTVHGFIEYRGILGIVMEYVDGESLEKLIFRQGRVHLYDAVYVMKQILAGIGYAHSKGFIHRDIKPSNIIFNAEGIAKIMDFGISKSLFEKSFTKTGAKVGTIYYMSPEQIRGDQLTQHSDIYSLGCTFYEMVVGKPPYDSDSEYKVMDAHLNQTPPKISQFLPGMPAQLDEIVTRALSKNPGDRQQTCEEMLDELRQLDKQIADLQDKYSTRIKPNPKKMKVYSIFGFSVFIVLLLALSYFAYNQVDSLLKSKSLENLKKYNIETLFEKDDNLGITLTQLKWIDSGVKFKLNSVYFSDNNRGIAAGDSGTVLITENGGQSWRKINLRSTNTFHDAVISNSDKVIVAGEKGEVYVSDNLFISYNKYILNENGSLFKISKNSAGSYFIAGSNGKIYHTEDGGKTWVSVNTGTDKLLYDIEFVDSETGFAAGWDGVFLKTTNAGITWSESEPFTEKYIKDIDFYNDELGMAVGGGNQIYKTDDGGESWSVIPFKQRGGIQAVKFITGKLILIPGNSGELLISKDEGDDWSILDTKTFLNFTAITKTSNGNIYLAGVNGRILKIQ